MYWYVKVFLINYKITLCISTEAFILFYVIFVETCFCDKSNRDYFCFNAAFK